MQKRQNAEANKIISPSLKGLERFEYDGSGRRLVLRPPALPPLALRERSWNDWGLDGAVPQTVYVPAAAPEVVGLNQVVHDDAPDGNSLTPAPKTVVTPNATLESIRAIRNSFRSLIGEVQNWEWDEIAADSTPAKPSLQAPAESPDDRVALAPAEATAPSPTVPTPTVRPEPRLAEPTLAQTNGRPTESAPPTSKPAPTPTTAAPRIAMRPDAAPLPSATSRAEQQPVEPPKQAPVLRYEPTAMLEMLHTVESATPFASWAAAALEAVDILTHEQPSGANRSAEAVGALVDLANEASNHAADAENYHIQSTWLRLGHALSRRLPVWQRLADPVSTRTWKPAITTAGRESIERALQEIAALTEGKTEGAEWNEFLLVDELAALTSVGADGQVEQRRKLAREFLHRTAAANLTEAQRQFIAQPPIDSLRRNLQPWASGMVNLTALAGLIDRFEATGAARYGDVIREQIARMIWSGERDFQELAELLDRTYRGANMRVALAGKLFNRMLPRQEMKTAPVRQRIAGREIRGHSHTSTRLYVRLLPDPNVLRLGLEATGDVRSRTYSDTWPAQVRNVGQMQYEVRKLIVINRNGLHTWPADAHAAGSNNLVGVESQLDLVPIVGSIVQGIAREQHRQTRSLALRQVGSRVANEARARMDREADAKLRALEDRFETAVMRPLESLALVAEPMDMHTTEQRAVMRLRIANDEQMAAYTPRPSAPSDSLASVQLHESALNNAARGLLLEGRTMDAVELQQILAEKLRRPLELAPEDVQYRASITFADYDAVRLRCHGDRVELILGIEELARGRDNIRNMEVHAFFRPIVDGLGVKLVRDGTLQFDGYRLPPAQRIVLHTVFGKLLPKDEEFAVLTPKIASDARPTDLMVTQLVIENGWLALAIGPRSEHRVTWRAKPASWQ